MKWRIPFQFLIRGLSRSEPPPPQHFYCRVSVGQFTPFSLGKTHGDMSSYFVALLQHPIFKVKLLANDLKGLIENLAWILIRAGLNG